MFDFIKLKRKFSNLSGDFLEERFFFVNFLPFIVLLRFFVSFLIFLTLHLNRIIFLGKKYWEVSGLKVLNKFEAFLKCLNLDVYIFLIYFK